jgi:integrase
MMENARSSMRAHLSAVWLLGIRLGTLPKIRHIILNRKSWQTPIAGWKGRQSSLQNAWKFAPLTAAMKKFFMSRASRMTLVPDSNIFNIPPRKIISFMKRFDPRLTGHSPRRGAAKHLSEHGITIPQIKVFLTHKSEESTILYIDPTPEQPEAIQELHLTSLLMAKH